MLCKELGLSHKMDSSVFTIAKQKGKYKSKPINMALHEQIKQKYADGMNKSQIAKALGCARATIYNAFGS